MVGFKSRGEIVENIIKSFLLNGYEESVLLDTYKDSYCTVFSIKPSKKVNAGLKLQSV